MGLFPEKEPKTDVTELGGEEPSALTIERKEVVTPVPTHFKAQVTDDSGKPLIQTPQTKKIRVVVPAVNEEELKIKAKEKTDMTISWNASFLLRVIQKAIHFGKQILFSPAIKREESK